MIGAGAVGLGVAFELASSGAEVTVFESRRLGGGASHGNAGWITPALCAAPVPAPGIVRQAFRWMLQPDSPFLLRPRLDLHFAHWLWRFSRACTPTAFNRGMRALVGHNRFALEALLSWRERGVDFELHREGLLCAALTDDALKQEQMTYQQVRSMGFPLEFEVLDGEQLREREPALSDSIRGGIASNDEWHVRPESLTHGLAIALRSLSAEIQEGIAVEALERRGDTWRINGLDADRVVVAAGVWTRDLLRPLGVQLPLEGAKGSSVTARGEGVQPRHAIYMLEAKVACSPYERDVRLAGTLELGARTDLSLNKRRITAVAAAAERYLRWRPINPDHEWAGLRPLLPDGLPAVGRLPHHPGLFVATGHGMAGTTLAAVSAKLLAPPEKQRDAHEMLFTLPAVQAEISKVLRSWFAKQKRLEPVFNLFFGLL